MSSKMTQPIILTLYSLHAGAMYNADLQCRLQFNQTDDTVRVCSKVDEICSQLWCLVNEVCVTQLRPAAPGTHCGKHKVYTYRLVADEHFFFLVRTYAFLT